MASLLRSGLIGAATGGARAGAPLSLADVLDAERVLPALAAAPGAAARLAEHLPAGCGLEEALRSPQLRQAADALTAALADADNAMAVWASMGLRPEGAAAPAARADPVGAFLAALAAAASAAAPPPGAAPAQPRP
jgi:hypothetical protein